MDNCLFFFFKQKTAYEMRISDWSSDVCSSDLGKRRQLEFKDRDEKLDGEDEESRDDDHPGDHEHRDLDEIVEEVDWPDQLLRLFQQGPGRLEARSRQPSWKQQILRPDRAAACGQTEPGEASEYDVGQRRKTVQDQRERSEEHTSELQSLMRISYA